MARNIRQVVADIDGLTPLNPDDLDLDLLHALAVEYFSSADAPTHLDVWFRLYERFPESDGNGVFWSILHGVEDQPGSNEFVVSSVLRNPTQFPVLMVNRMLNGGITSVGEVELLSLLRSVAASPHCSESVRLDADQFLKHQQGQG